MSEHLAQAALPTDNLIGQQIHVGELNFTVIGTFRERVATFGQSEIREDSVLVPFPLIKYYAGDNFILTLYAQAQRPEDVPQVTEQVGRKSSEAAIAPKPTTTCKISRLSFKSPETSPWR